MKWSEVLKDKLYIGRDNDNRDGRLYEKSMKKLVFFSMILVIFSCNPCLSYDLETMMGVWGDDELVIDYSGDGESFFIAPDLEPPQITIISPTTKTYTNSNILFQVSTNKNSACSYSLDSGITNYSLTANVSNTGFTASRTLTNEVYVAQFYCRSLSNNLNSTESVSFTVDVGAAPSVGNGGGGRGVDSVVSKEFTLDKTQINVKLKQGETMEVAFNISNPTRVKKKMEVTSDMEDMMKIYNDFSLEGGETKEVKIDIIAKETKTPDVYLGRIYITDGKVKKEILILIEVVSKESLFDIELEIFNEDLKISPGEEMTFEIALMRLLQRQETMDVTVNYVIKDEEENEVLSLSDTRAIETTLSFVKRIDLPEDLIEGKYFLYVQVEYEGKIASASSWFEVESEKSLVEFIKDFKSYLISTAVMILLLIIAFFAFRLIKNPKNVARKKRKKRSRRK
ncbi:hypothetical protein KAT36_03275 [Candidatus Pacearchaeota archaeon]|nr:hypothetical protein [Candidatus Pacearchaeota archaeon]